MSWCVFIPRSTGTHSDISACFFLAPAEMCPFRGVLIQCFGASSQHTAVDAIGMHIHPRLTSGVTEMWHLRCHVVSGSMHPHPHHAGLSHRGSRITTPMQSVRTLRMRPHPHAPVSSPHTSPHPHHVRLSHRGSRITTPMQSVRTHRMRPHPHAPVSSPHTSPHPHHVGLSHRGSRIMSPRRSVGTHCMRPDPCANGTPSY